MHHSPQRITLPDPSSRPNVDRALELVDAFRQIYYDALDAFARNPTRDSGRRMEAALRHGAITLSEALLIIEQLLEKHQSPS